MRFFFLCVSGVEYFGLLIQSIKPPIKPPIKPADTTKKRNI